MAWEIIPIGGGVNGTEEAPQDNIQYARLNGEWTETIFGEVIGAGVTLLSATTPPVRETLISLFSGSSALPSAAITPSDFQVTVRNDSGSGIVYSVVPDGSDTVNGVAASFPVEPGEEFVITRTSSTNFDATNVDLNPGKLKSNSSPIIISDILAVHDVSEDKTFGVLLSDLPLQDEAEKAQANGYASLDGGGQIPLAQIPTSIQGGITVIGFWDAATNTPDLSSLTQSQGEAFQVSVAGTTLLNGESNWGLKDLAVWDDNLVGNWFKLDNTDDVLSVNSMTGVVVLGKSDIGLGNVDNTSDADKPVSTAQQTALDTKIETVTTVFDANTAIYPSSNPATANSRNGHPVINFDDTIAEKVILSSVMSKTYAGGSISVDIDWVAETAIIGGVTWGVEVEASAPGGNDIDTDSFDTQQTGTSTTNGSSGIITRTTITLTQAEADGVASLDSYRLRLQRVTGDGGDTMIDDAQIIKISVTNG